MKAWHEIITTYLSIQKNNDNGTKNFLLDFDLYLCERFGYSNSLHVAPAMNGCCIGMSIRTVKLYIRFWEYSNGVGGLPDWCIILVHCNFAKKQDVEL